MARAFSYPAAQPAHGVFWQYHRSSARRHGRSPTKSAPLLTPGDGNLHLGSLAAGIEKPQRGRATGFGVRVVPWAIAFQRIGEMNPGLTSKLRTFLVLGRISNIPTVWSNCLAGWWLAGGGPSGNVASLFRVLISVSFLYVGGMYLNDAFDSEFDRSKRPERPIPSGLITARIVWACGFGWLYPGTCRTDPHGQGHLIVRDTAGNLHSHL